MSILKCLALAMLLLPINLFAQIQVIPSLQYGISYVADKAQGNHYYKPIYSHGAKVSLYVPVYKTVGLTTGLGYIHNGMNGRTVNHDTADKHTTIFDFETRLRYLSIPLLATFRLIKYGQSEWWIDAGMNYNIFLDGYIDYDIQTYNARQGLVSQGKYKVPQKSGFGTTRLSNVRKFEPFTFMDVMCKLQVRYVYQKKYMAGVYYDHALYSLNNSQTTEGAKMRNAGVMLGIVL